MRSRTIIKQGHFLDVTPFALRSVFVDGLHLVQVSASLGQVLNSVELVGDTCDEAISLITSLGSAQLRCSNLASINPDRLDFGVIVGSELDLLTLAAVEHNRASYKRDIKSHILITTTSCYHHARVLVARIEVLADNHYRHLIKSGQVKGVGNDIIISGHGNATAIEIQCSEVVSPTLGQIVGCIHVHIRHTATLGHIGPVGFSNEITSCRAFRFGAHLEGVASHILVNGLVSPVGAE